MKLSSVIGLIGKVAALGAVFVAVAIAIIPRFLYDSLPADLSLDFTKPTTVIVTGANSGLGLATVQNFAHNEKATIIMACRSMARCENAKQQIHNHLGSDAKANLLPMAMDLSQKSSMEEFAQELQGQPIDILIHNAGLAGISKELEYHQEDGIETHIRVNHLGPMYLTHCLWKNLLLADSARIVAVSSIMAGPQSNSPTFGWYEGEERYATRSDIRRMYGCSKRANLFFANELHRRYYKDTTISVTAAHPGWTHTELCKKGCQGQPDALRFLSTQNFFTGSIKMAPEVAALSQGYAAVIPQAGIYLGPALVIVGEPKILGTLSGSRHHASFSRDESKHLWDKSMEALGIETFGEFEIPVESESDEDSSGSEESESSSEESESEESDSEDDIDEDSSDEEEEEVWNIYLGDGPYKESVMM